jgi:hypothetical protein
MKRKTPENRQTKESKSYRRKMRTTRTRRTRALLRDNSRKKTMRKATTRKPRWLREGRSRSRRTMNSMKIIKPESLNRSRIAFDAVQNHPVSGFFFKHAMF